LQVCSRVNTPAPLPPTTNIEGRKVSRKPGNLILA
jgi:hypothetical protein